MSDEDMPMAECISKAEEIGTANGTNAASWTINGNTDHNMICDVADMFDAGDPAVYNMFREPSFSGEYSGDYSERDLFDEIGIDYDRSTSEEIADIADAYLEAARAAFWGEVERLYRPVG